MKQKQPLLCQKGTTCHCAGGITPVRNSWTTLVRKPIIARRPTHTSLKGLKPNRPSSVGRPMLSANCGKRRHNCEAQLQYNRTAT